jgi:hypothetical protein
MKKIIFLIMMFISITSYSQNRKSYSEGSSNLGLCITGGGVAFSIAGFLTPPNYTYVYAPNSTSNYNFQRQSLPFFQQGPRALCIVTGVAFTVTGLITMLAKK